MKRVLINVEDRELRVAILEDEQLVEFYSESLDERSILNNIYRGRIEGILPGLNAAFVNVGLERNAFLHFEDVRPDVIAAKAGIPRIPAKATQEATAEEVPLPLMDQAAVEARTADLTYNASEEELEAAREIVAEMEEESEAEGYLPDGEETRLVPTGIAPHAHRHTAEEDEDEDSETGEAAPPRGQRPSEESDEEDAQGRGRRRRRRGRRGGRRREFEDDEQRPVARSGASSEDGEFDEDEDGAESALPRRAARPEGEEDEDAEAAELAAERHERPERGRGRRHRRDRFSDEDGERSERFDREREPEVKLFFDPRLAKRMDRRGGKPEDWANHRGFEPPSGYAMDWVMPDDDADAGTRASVNPFEGVFTPGASLSKRWKIMALKRTRNQADGQEVFFGVPRREEDPNANPARDTQEAIFGSVRVKYDENGDPIPVSGPQVIAGVRYDGPRSGGSGKYNKFKKKRKRKGRHMKRNDRSFFAVRRKKSEDPEPEVVEAAPAKTSRARKAKPAEEPVVEAVAPKAAKPKASRAKTKVVEEVTEAPAPPVVVEESAPAKAAKGRTSRAKAKPDAVEVPEVAQPAPVVPPAQEPEATAAKSRPSRSRKAKAEDSEVSEAPVQSTPPAPEPVAEPAEADAARSERPARGRRKPASAGPTESAPAVVDQTDFLAEDTSLAASAPADSEDGDSEEDDGGRRRRRRGRRGGRRHRDQAGGDEISTEASSPRDSAPQSAPQDGDRDAGEGIEESGTGEAPAPGKPEYRSRRDRDRERRDRKKDLRWNRPDKAAQPQNRDERPPREERPPRDDRRDRKDRRDHQAPRPPRQKLPSFIETFNKGDDIMVQVIKEEIGTKGARITTFASLPGRYLVLLPYPNEEGGVSRKVEDMTERRRLKKLLRDISGDDYGFIIRTAGIEKDEEEIKKDAEFLVQEWRAIQESYQKAKATDLVASDQDILYKLCRDVFDESIGEIIIDDASQADHLRNILGRMIPGLVDRVAVHEESENLFVKYGVDKQLAKAARRKVWLKSGGYIIIDEAEALTAIDVNTGKFVGKDDQEKMILKTNLEAARTIARELKLRDIGGLIVVDFIDMKDQRNRDQVQQEFRACLKKDRSKTQVSNISEFGLIEMTRKRVRRSLRKTLFADCPYCQGAGVILSERQIWLHIKHEVVRVLEASQGQTDTLTVTVNPRVKQHVESTYRDSIQRLEKRYSAKVVFAPTDLMHMENFRFERSVKAGATVRPEEG